ncbi:MAG TPA: aminoacyl-tRNA hydrolase [Thermoanaerobaculaceae bacterium]|nr:aminoacyl-tRNA hydrolase [Thermoanaerobaculaceae bacterium]HRS15054.1 aminoacyl-tRNA hydrolase [Thermoanaerobaculaceae bacterium]
MDIAAVVGLGNPGREYEATRHNIGFQVIDALAAKWRVPPFRLGRHVLSSRRGGSRPVWLVKPQDYMNLSGPAVAAFAAAESLAPPQILVVVDDVELPLGQLRLRSSGGAGTHNGLRSLVESLGEGFARLRLGIRGASPWRDLAEYVLAPFEDGELDTARAMVGEAVACVEMALHAGLGRAASRYNRAPAPSTPAGAASP